MNLSYDRNHQQRIYMTIKLLLIIIDLLINSLHEYTRTEILALILIFIIQDLCIILLVTLLVFSFLSAFVIQVDSVQVLYKRFSYPVILCICYLVSTVSLQALVLTIRWAAPLKFKWTNGLIVLSSIQKILAVLHYYFYKRTTLKLYDPSLLSN